MPESTSTQGQDRFMALAMLQDLIQVVSRSLDLDNIINNALDKIMELFQCTFTTMYLADQATGEHVLRAQRGISADDFARLRKRRQPGEGLASIVVPSARVIVFEDINHDPRYGSRQGFARQVGCHSLVFLPLIGKEKMLGSLAMTHRDPHRYSADQIQLFTAIGYLIGTALENAYLYLEKIKDTEKLTKALEKLNLAQAAANAGTWEWDLRTNENFWSEELWKLLGLEPGSGAPSYRLFLETVHQDDRPRIKQLARAMALRAAELNTEWRVNTSDAIVRWLMCRARPMMNVDGAVAGYIGIIFDITERKHAEEQILSLSNTDQLTGLCNRRGFITLAGQQLKNAARSNMGLILLFADLDDLKWINDNLGHNRGDEAIIEAASILQEACRQEDIIARIGGDEFLVLTSGWALNKPDILRNRIQQYVDIHNARKDRDYTISMSIGMAYKDHETHDISSSIDALMSEADALMYEQKRCKR